MLEGDGISSKTGKTLGRKVRNDSRESAYLGKLKTMKDDKQYEELTLLIHINQNPNRKDDLAAKYQSEGLLLMKNEDKINLDRCPLKKGKGDDEITGLKHHMKRPDGTLFGIERDAHIQSALVINQLIMLYQDANNGYTGRDYVTALRLIYGMDNSNRIVILYKPARFKRVLNAINIDNRIYEYEDEKINTPYYTWETDHFEKRKDLFEVEGLIANYKKVQIEHFKGRPFTPYIEGIDTKEAVFSFQEVFNFICDEDGLVNSLCVYNGVFHDMYNPYVQMRHAIVLASKKHDRDTGFIKDDFKGYHANLAHLCPPHCKIIYRLDP